MWIKLSYLESGSCCFYGRHGVSSSSRLFSVYKRFFFMFRAKVGPHFIISKLMKCRGALLLCY